MLYQSMWMDRSQKLLLQTTPSSSGTITINKYCRLIMLVYNQTGYLFRYCYILTTVLRVSRSVIEILKILYTFTYYIVRSFGRYIDVGFELYCNISENSKSLFLLLRNFFAIRLREKNCRMKRIFLIIHRLICCCWLFFDLEAFPLKFHSPR